MILKTVIATLDALTIILFASFGLEGLKEKDKTISRFAFALVLLIAINIVMMWR